MKKIYLYFLKKFLLLKELFLKIRKRKPLTIKDDSGNCIVVIEELLFSKSKVSKNYNNVAKMVRKLLNNLNGDSVLMEETGKRVYFDRIFPGEFVYSKDTKNLYSRDRTAKMNAVKEIKYIVRKARYIKHSKLKESKKAAKQKRRVDATNGFDYYQLYFAYKKGKGYDVYSAILNVRIDKNNKSFVYDITRTSKIRRNGTKPINYRQKL